MMELQHSQHVQNLEGSLLDLHASVHKLIKIIQDNAETLDKKNEILNKLPMLDFYNDELLRNIASLRRKA
jgi:hypothetical protein